VLPNAWDHASAAALFAAGFPAVGTTSLGVAIAAGKPDGAAATKRETIDLVRLIAPLGPVTADVERGFSDAPEDVAELAEALVAHGAVGINIEDGVDERWLADVDRQCMAIAAVKRRAPDLFVNARIDTYWAGVSPNVEDTLRRAERYVAAGADGIFVPGVREPREIEALAGSIARPLNVLFAPELHTVAELAVFGARRISTGSLLFRAAIGTTVAVAREISGGARAAGAGAPSYDDAQRLAARPSVEGVASALGALHEEPSDGCSSR